MTANLIVTLPKEYNQVRDIIQHIEGIRFDNDGKPYLQKFFKDIIRELTWQAGHNTRVVM